jgi:hypothetical protein
MDDSGFMRLMGRGVDVVELSADGATDEEMGALADVLDDLDTEQKAAEVKGQMRRAGLLW